MLGIGGFTPLDGFMTRADWKGVCDEMRTADGAVLADSDHAVGGPARRRLDQARRARSRSPIPTTAALLASMKVREKYAHRQGARVQVGVPHRPMPRTPASRW